MNRRDFVTHAAAAAATLAVSPNRAFASEATPASSLAEISSDCATKGELCLQHCVESLSTGSKAMADCAASVREMIVYCDALAKAAAGKSKHLKALAKITRDVCLDCETQCRKHEKMDVCKVCADACAACAKACASA